jgi:hypothetical protein
MKRMICVGAQAVQVTTVASSMPNSKIPCRRSEDYIETHVVAHGLPIHASHCNLQYPLFAIEELNLTAPIRALGDAFSAF